jgi:membrane protease subunit HflC
MKRNPLTLIIGLLLVFIFGLWLFVFQVRTTDVAVVTTFGRPTRPLTEPGAYVKLPWPIQKVWLFDKRVQNFEDKLTQGLTRDNFNLLTSVYVGWRITNPTEFFPVFAGSANPIGEAEKVLERLLGNAKSAVVGTHPLSDFVSATDNGTNFVGIENEILTVLQSQVRSNSYGLEIEFLGLKKLELPENVTQSVFERMTSERKVLADRLQYEGEAEAQKIRSDAERKAAEMQANADAEATKIKGYAEAEAAKSLAAFQQNPALANFIFRLNALEGSLKERSILVFDQHTPPFDLFLGASTNLLNRKP